MRRELLTVTRVSAVTAPAIGAPYLGGYYVGIIDTTKGNIIAADASQVGRRYELILAPRSMETTKNFQTPVVAGPAATRTRWDGLTSTNALVALGATKAPAAEWCAAQVYPADTASPWYLPALDELELIYRTLKPTTASNDLTASTMPTFPGGASPYTSGYNPSSDPPQGIYTLTSPAQTAVVAFQTLQPQSLDKQTPYRYQTSTEGSATAPWLQQTIASPGQQLALSKSTVYVVRPVRRNLI